MEGGMSETLTLILAGNGKTGCGVPAFDRRTTATGIRGGNHA
jgi:hypothetical protein